MAFFHARSGHDFELVNNTLNGLLTPDRIENTQGRYWPCRTHGAFIVGLTAHDMSDMGRLAQLAINPQSGASREKIYLAVASLYRIQGSGLNTRERELMRDILRRLTRDVEMAIRVALAQRLTEDTTAPHDLILLLVDDSIEVARPLILHSPLLTENDMLKLIAEAGAPHQEAVAGRPNIGESVTSALASCDHESVLLALVRNVTAKISETTYNVLVEKSRAMSGLAEPLVRRPDLPPQLATQMCGWVSDALKSYIQTNYNMSSRKMDSALADANLVLQSEPAGPKDPPADSAQKLIEKLAASGQLKAGFLMRVLSQGQADLFDLAFARLLEIELERFRTYFYKDEAHRVALACRAAGIDRSVFPTVFNLSRQTRNGQAALTPADIAEAEKIFSLARPAALEQIRAEA
jgi:uncharacterized protein (DUF2336 family)